MFGGNEPQGFTILETMLFLAISGILFLSVVTLIENRQANTNFFQDEHQIYSQVQDLASSVETGYYNDTNNYSCSINTAAPVGTSQVTVSVGGGNLGTNTGCTYIGEILQFGYNVGSTTTAMPDAISIYSVFGQQYQPGATYNQPPQNFQQAQPVAVLSSTLNLPKDLSLDKVKYSDGSILSGTPQQDNLVGFFYNFSGACASCTIKSGSLNDSLIPIPDKGDGSLVKQSDVQSNSTTSGIVSSLNQDIVTGRICDSYITGSVCSIPNPNNGVKVCFSSHTKPGLYVQLTIGGNGAGNSSGNPLNISLNSVGAC